jgi:hypothetical protein
VESSRLELQSYVFRKYSLNNAPQPSYQYVCTLYMHNRPIYVLTFTGTVARDGFWPFHPILFSVVFIPFSPQPPRLSMGPSFLLLIYTVSPLRVCLIIWWERFRYFRRTQKEGDLGPSISISMQSALIPSYL